MNLEDDEKEFGPYVVTDDGTLMMGGLGISLDAVLSIARSVGERPYPGAELKAVKYLVYDLNAACVALRRQVALAEAARTIHEAVRADENLVAAIDAAYRVGGAVAVRDLVLRGIGAPHVAESVCYVPERVFS